METTPRRKSWRRATGAGGLSDCGDREISRGGTAHCSACGAGDGVLHRSACGAGGEVEGRGGTSRDLDGLEGTDEGDTVWQRRGRRKLKEEGVAVGVTAGWSMVILRVKC